MADYIGDILQTDANPLGDIADSYHYGLKNVTSGGTWTLSGNELAHMNYDSAEAELARRFSAFEAQKQRDFEERLSNTAYSRAVADMKRAGLNPYLMYSNGGYQAVTPSGSSAQTVSASAGSGKTRQTSGNTAQAVGSALFAIAKLLTISA